MYTNCSTLAKAQDVLVELSIRNFAFRNALVAGIHQEAQWEEEGDDNHKTFHVNTCEPITLDGLLESSAEPRDVPRGRKLHAYIAQRGLIENNAVVGMYGIKVQEMFDELPFRNAVSWNALIVGYAQHGHVDKAITCIDQMQNNGLSPNVATFTSILKKCVSTCVMDKGQLVHAQIDKIGLLDKNIIVGTALVDMYAKFGALTKAREVFDKLLVQDVVSWNVLIAGYVQHGLGEEALKFFEEMQHKGLSPNTVTFACILKACGSIGAAVKGQEIHARIVKEILLGKSIVAANALADMYAKCGSLERTQKVFHELLVRDAVSWNTLITAYIQHKHEDNALKCFERMQCEGLSPTVVTFACILKTCSCGGALAKAQEVHARISQEAVEEKGKVLAIALLDMYVKCGSLDKAQVVFDRLQVRDVVSWTVLVGGYAQQGCGEEALIHFDRMQCESISPNAVTFICVLKACGSIRASDKAHRLHARIVNEGSLEKDIVVANTLMDTYIKCGSLLKAQELFNKLPVQDLVSWNVLISGYAQHGHGEDALNCFEMMQSASLFPDAFTYACILKACGTLGAAYEGQEIHAKIVRDGLLENDMIVANALVDMFAKCGMLAEAQELFNELLVRDVVSWNSLIAGYAQHGLAEEALSRFEQMRGAGFMSDAYTIASILKACGSIGAAYKGQEVHVEIARDWSLETDMVIGTALVDMYAKFGMLADAQDVFDELPILDGASMNALLAGYAQLGEDEFLAKSFEKLIEEGKMSDLVTFTIVLNTCSHRGLLDKGLMYFETMSTGYGFVPTFEHYACIIDLFGRAGHLDKAALVIKEMPFHANRTVWLTLLGACRKWGNMELGRWAFENAAQMDEKDTAAYVCMRNIYAAVDMQEDGNEIEPMRAKTQTWKDARGIIRSLYIANKNHSQGNNIFAKLEGIAQKSVQEESISNLLQMSHNIIDETEEDSKDLAIASAFINAPKGMPIS